MCSLNVCVCMCVLCVCACVCACVCVCVCESVHTCTEIKNIMISFVDFNLEGTTILIFFFYLINLKVFEVLEAEDVLSGFTRSLSCLVVDHVGVQSIIEVGEQWS